MTKKIKYLILFLIFSGCGFKVINLSEIKNYYISQINTSGDKRINYTIKNQLLISERNKNKDEIVLDLNTKKNKVIKEKNIKNEITKYSIEIIVAVKVTNFKLDELTEFKISNSGTYNVAAQNSQTINNEKKLIKLLSENLSDEIIKKLSTILNDL